MLAKVVETQISAFTRGKTVLAVLCFVRQTVTIFLVLDSSLFFDSEKAVKQGWGRGGVRQGWQEMPDMQLQEN